MGNMSGIISFAFWVASWVTRALKCEVVNFIKDESAGISTRPFEYLCSPILFKAHAACTFVHDAMPNVMSQGLHTMQTMSP